MVIPYSRDQEGQKFWFARESVKKLIYVALSLCGRKQRITWAGFGINLFYMENWAAGPHPPNVDRPTGTGLD
jgi:hypothetical protein